MPLSKNVLALAISASFLSSPLYANENADKESAIEVITVLGDFRQTNLQKTPSSLSVVTDESISLRNAQNLEEIVAAIPNINFSSGSQRARYYQIRGIGERSQFNEPINPSVGIIIDDIDFTGMGSIASTFDVAQTEVYRGPQGTRFGSNAMAGLINITTNEPSDTFEGKVQLQAGNYNSKGAGLALSGPASDSVNYRLALQKYESDGFIENTFLNRKDTNNRDELSVRGKLAIDVNQNLKVDISVVHFNFDNGYDAFSLDNTRQTLSDQPGFDQQETTAIASKFTYVGNENVEVVGLVSHADSDLNYGYDEDWSYVGLHPWEYSSTDHYLRDRKTQTAELRFLSTEYSQLFNATTSWIAGVYYKQDNEDLTRQYTYLDNNFTSDFDTKTFALFAQFNSKLSNKLDLETGLRVENRQADYINSDQLSFDPDETMVGGKVVLSYQYQEGALFYGSINRGYKTGGVNTDGTLPANLREFDAEYLWNYELGYKADIFSGDGYLRTALFYMDRKDVQIRSSFSVLRDDNSSEFISYLGNAASGFNRGIEFESGWYVNDFIELNANIGLLETEFDDFINSNGDNLSGREQAHAPSYQYHLSAKLQPNENWLINFSIEGKDKFYFSDSHIQKSDTINLVNASVVFYQDDWQVKLWARNVFDKDYKTRGFYFGNDPRDGYTAKAYTQLAEPAVFGITFDYEF